MGQYPGWRTMTKAQRYNAKMDALFKPEIKRLKERDEAMKALELKYKTPFGAGLVDIGAMTRGERKAYRLACADKENSGWSGGWKSPFKKAAA